MLQTDVQPNDLQRHGTAFLLALAIHLLVSGWLVWQWPNFEPDESLRDVTSLALMISSAAIPDPVVTPPAEVSPAAPPPAPMIAEEKPVMAAPPVSSQPPAPVKPAHKPRPPKPVESKPTVPAMGQVQAPEAKAVTDPVIATQASLPTPVVQEAPPAPSLSAAARADISAAYRSMVHARIAAAQVYPAHARRMGEEGTVLVRFVILADGRIEGVRVIESSGSDSLDAATIDIFIKGLGGQLPAIPTELNKSSWTFSIPIRYQLQAG